MIASCSALFRGLLGVLWIIDSLSISFDDWMLPSDEELELDASKTTGSEASEEETAGNELIYINSLLPV